MQSADFASVVDRLFGGINDMETRADVPDAFNGYIWTDRIELLGPLIPDDE